MPELQDACRATLQQLAAISASSDFRSRCANPNLELPVEAPLLALAGETTEAGTTCTVEEVNDDATSVWSLLQSRELSRDESDAVKRVRPELILSSVNSIERAVFELNEGILKIETEFCIVYAQSQLLFILMYKTGCEEVADAAIKHMAQGGDAGVSLSPGSHSPRCDDEAENENVALRMKFAKEESKFYEALLVAVCPYFGEVLTREQAKIIFGHACLEEWQLDAVLDEVGNTSIDAETLQRLGRLVASLQADPETFKDGAGFFSAGRLTDAIRQRPADRLPKISGVSWNADRGRVNISGLIERLEAGTRPP